MPVHLVKVGNRYKVIDKSGKIHAKGTTLKKAQAQQRLLNAIAHKTKKKRPKKK